MSFITQSVRYFASNKCLWQFQINQINITLMAPKNQSWTSIQHMPFLLETGKPWHSRRYLHCRGACPSSSCQGASHSSPAGLPRHQQPLATVPAFCLRSCQGLGEIGEGAGGIGTKCETQELAQTSSCY